MLIREELPGDIAAIHRINTAAFDTETEANLVDALREQKAVVVSLVAEEQGELVGHILFSPVTLSPDSSIKVAGLAPMAVLPARQNRGIGSALVREGIARCRQLGHEAIVVLGHPHYYPRFGFVPSVKYGIRSEYDVPEEVFMVLELKPEALKDVTGVVRFHPAFAMV
jgi:putative acetyltransferase